MAEKQLVLGLHKICFPHNTTLCKKPKFKKKQN